eukprot:CAMPEP_0185583752 /NCGR_PEP_ID=MMETSP0434-20130131/27397_1 /TAXON_ID=626734 ORGANISM="Favella taraikaensis, Strain Fe Narragansett Bay" /NCGR_SAMPLE_ID=MMETSP0434 /ASSEMBLY_ACC=CAM_ASM_000379 /LENGTH=30 /DNA_ID= /DNA_START= /DNA_END= /DNA_ORIENTATION=
MASSLAGSVTSWKKLLKLMLSQLERHLLKL